MKLLRYGTLGAEKPGIFDADGQIRDLSKVITDIAGVALSDNTLDELRAIEPTDLPLVADNPRIGACVGSVGKFICIGLNYADHAAESGATLPAEPIIFAKATSSICGANDDIKIPRGAVKTDWEVELGVVVGKHTKYVDEANAMTHVAGYCVVTRDEVNNPQNLSMYLQVNGHRYQDGTTKTMYFGVAYIVSYLSQFMSLQAGDEMELGIAGLGVQRQKVVSDQ